MSKKDFCLIIRFINILIFRNFEKWILLISQSFKFLKVFKLPQNETNYCYKRLLAN